MTGYQIGAEVSSQTWLVHLVRCLSWLLLPWLLALSYLATTLATASLPDLSRLPPEFEAEFQWKQVRNCLDGDIVKGWDLRCLNLRCVVCSTLKKTMLIRVEI